MAFRITGSRKAPTPLDTASTPVMAVQPEAKARSSSQTLTPSTAWPRAGGATMGCGWPWAASIRIRPSAISSRKLAMKT